jgi:hypothetical protein
MMCNLSMIKPWARRWIRREKKEDEEEVEEGIRGYPNLIVPKFFSGCYP